MFSGVAAATVHHVAPGGLPTNTGTEVSPWDIQSALSGQHAIAPGDTIAIREGVYRHPDRTWHSKGFEINLQGTPDKPIHIRPANDKRVTLDGKVEVKPESAHLWLWNLEITVSETENWNRRTTAGGAEPDPPATLPQGGFNILGGVGCKYINLTIHDMAAGVGFWRGAADSEMHGCLIYNNGSIGPDRYHGPGIYTQNQNGHRWITDNILFGNYSTTLQAYGSKAAYVDGFQIIGNIAFAPVKAGQRAQILIGGDRPSRDITVRENLLYEVPLQIGYTAPHNENAVVHDNRIARAGMSINNFKQVDQQNNLVWNDSNIPADRDAEIFLRPNHYDKKRAHLAVFNWKRQPQIAVDLTPFLKPGDKFRVVNALDYDGPPVASGVYSDKPAILPMPIEPRTDHGAFCAFIVFIR